jgi:dihydrofolate reductase
MAGLDDGAPREPRGRPQTRPQAVLLWNRPDVDSRPGRSIPNGRGPLADRLNSLPKYVVSSTLEDPGWNNTTVVKGDVVAEVSKLKQELEGKIVLAASFQLLHTLMEHDLVDELRLMIYPVVLGAGKRLFGETSEKRPMRLLAARIIAGDLAYLTYQPVRDA